MRVKKNKGFFSISAVAKMFSVHQQTIRLYEKEGLINPKRSSGNTRLFSEDDIDRLEEVIYLTHQLGINLAGVQMILKLKKKIDKMQKEMNRAFDRAKEQLDEETEQTKLVVRNTAKQLVKLKQRSILDTAPEEHSEDTQIEPEDWDIKYEEDD
ncbi:MAG: MerR family transcriptional regulator [Candidatus Dependentiae bacterium]